MKDYSIGQKFAFISTEEKYEKAQELTEKGYEFDIKFITTPFGDVWILTITGCIDATHTTQANDECGDELLPCPFCGATENKNVMGRSGLVMTGEEGIFQVFCFDCCCSSDYFRSEKEARKRWNTRVTKGGVQE